MSFIFVVVCSNIIHQSFFFTETPTLTPQLNINSDSYIEQFSEGIDIVVAMDASGSMLATDFKPDRFEASKSVAKDFIAKRKEFSA